MNKIKSILLYAGLEKEEYKSIKNDYIEQNRRNLFWYSLVVMIIFGILGIFVLLNKEIFIENAIPYIGTAIAMALIMLCTRLLKGKQKNEFFISCLIYFFMTVLYLEATLVTLKHSDLPAVTFIGVLLALPLLFIDHPITIMSAQTVFVAAFCIIVAKYKNPDIASTDLWNGITFLIASWAEIVILIPMRISSMQKTKKIDFLSKNDLLTGVLNRNAYEEHTTMIAGKADETLVCVYVDVNGLHEINNVCGHEAGDIMLKTISKKLVDVFGYNETYRIGGDEFVILSVNRNIETVLQLLSGVKETLQKENYSVSFGTSALKDHNMDLHSTIKDAEQHMYTAKRQFYSEIGRDRRS